MTFQISHSEPNTLEIPVVNVLVPNALVKPVNVDDASLVSVFQNVVKKSAAPSQDCAKASIIANCIPIESE